MLERALVLTKHRVKVGLPTTNLLEKIDLLVAWDGGREGGDRERRRREDKKKKRVCLEILV